MSETEHNFNNFMLAGIRAHESGDHVLALVNRLAAFNAEPPTPVDRGRAARDVAASFDRIGNHTLGDTRDIGNQVLADAYAEYAYRDHKELRDSGDARGAREFTASAMYAAIIATRQNRNLDALTYINEGWRTSQELREINGIPHQYDVNMIGRVVGIEALYAAKVSKSLRDLGKEAISLAKLSETDSVLGANLALSKEQVKRAQKKAKLRGWAARSVAVMQALPTNNLTTPLANKIVQNVVL